MIISFIQTKGGTGKTTLAKCLAYSKIFQKTFSSICLIELDPQGTIKAWHNQRKENGISDKKVSFVELSQTDHKHIEDILIKLVSDNDAIVLDVPGESVGKFATRLAASLSDIVLIPMRSSTNDEQSFIDNIYPIVGEIISVNDTKNEGFFIIPTFVHPQTKPANIKGYFRDIMPDLVDCLDSFLPVRSVYENFSRDGMVLAEYAKSVKTNHRLYEQAQKAIADIEQIGKNILNIYENK